MDKRLSWFDVYGCDFGWAKLLAVRGGRVNMTDRKAAIYPERDGGVDVEVALLPEHILALEQDQEFWAAVLLDEALRRKE
ncbi:hypothetical protein QOZ80_8BG0652960 [Eleusine coracana subsp. coracana]|nr:hypothetical protein QOZ80_8BG0652960 [Eleusine coracana subsp. coracana]